MYLSFLCLSFILTKQCTIIIQNPATKDRSLHLDSYFSLLDLEHGFIHERRSEFIVGGRILKNYKIYPKDVIALILDYYRVLTFSLFKVSLNGEQIHHKLVSTEITQIYRSNKLIHMIDQHGKLSWIGEKPYTYPPEYRHGIRSIVHYEDETTKTRQPRIDPAVIDICRENNIKYISQQAVIVVT